MPRLMEICSSRLLRYSRLLIATRRRLGRSASASVLSARSAWGRGVAVLPDRWALPGITEADKNRAATAINAKFFLISLNSSLGGLETNIGVNRVSPFGAQRLTTRQQCLNVSDLIPIASRSSRTIHAPKINQPSSKMLKRSTLTTFLCSLVHERLAAARRGCPCKREPGELVSRRRGS